MKFSPLTDEQIESKGIAPEGTYSYRVIQSEDKIGKDSGNEYIYLMLEIWKEDSPTYIVFTNLSMAKLVKHFCDVNNLQDDYNSGILLANKCMGKGGGKVVIGIQDETSNKKGGMFPKKNIVKDYIFDPKGSLTSPLPPLENDEDLPF